MTNTTTPADIPVPAGAEADDWPSETDEGVLVRSLTWSHHDTIKVRVSVSAMQYADDGRFTPGIAIYGRDCVVDELTGDEARLLAAKLVEAAVELDRLR